jgi:flavin reductase (DIM6/NTAB) family NADH-FMN oxidoreductase RutF
VTRSSTAFTDAMSMLASGVVLVTCWLGDRPWGMTVTAFASVSAEPPTVLVSLGSETTSAHHIAATGTFGVAVLAADQLPLARYGAVPGAGKFLEPFVEPARPGGASPVVSEALAHLDCVVSERVDAGDHTVLFGRVSASLTARAAAPLVYQQRTYRTLATLNGRTAPCLSR